MRSNLRFYPTSGLTLLISLGSEGGILVLDGSADWNSRAVSKYPLALCGFVFVLNYCWANKAQAEVVHENKRGFGERMWAMMDGLELLPHKSVHSWQCIQQHLCHSQSHPWDLLTLGIVQLKQKYKNKQSKRCAVAAWKLLINHRGKKPKPGISAGCGGILECWAQACVSNNEAVSVWHGTQLSSATIPGCIFFQTELEDHTWLWKKLP